jgi:hypothetical protein
MKTKSNWFVFRAKNPHPKEWPGPWFKFGRENNVTGLASYKMLASYIGGEAYAEVHDHFKCVRGISHSMIVGGTVAQSLGVPNNTRWDFVGKK